MTTTKYIHKKSLKDRKLRKIENEEWKEISGSNGLYFISNIGRVKSFQFNKTEGQIINGSDIKGYRRVQININEQRKRVLVHKLVAEAFIPKPSDDCTHIIHLDWNKKNNQLSNLAWIAPADMHKRMFSDFKQRIKKKGIILIQNSKLKEADVKLLKSMLEKGIAQNVIAKLFHVSEMQITRIKRGENWGHVKTDSVKK